MRLGPVALLASVVIGITPGTAAAASHLQNQVTTLTRQVSLLRRQVKALATLVAQQAGINNTQAGVNDAQAGTNQAQAGINNAQADINSAQVGVNNRQAGENALLAAFFGCSFANPAGWFGNVNGTYTDGYAYKPNDGSAAFYTNAIDFASQPVGAPAGAESFRLFGLQPVCPKGASTRSRAPSLTQTLANLLAGKAMSAQTLRPLTPIAR